MLFQLASFVTFRARVRSLCKAGDTCTLEPPIDALVEKLSGTLRYPHTWKCRPRRLKSLLIKDFADVMSAFLTRSNISVHARGTRGFSAAG